MDKMNHDTNQNNDYEVIQYEQVTVSLDNFWDMQNDYKLNDETKLIQHSSNSNCSANKLSEAVTEPLRKRILNFDKVPFDELLDKIRRPTKPIRFCSADIPYRDRVQQLYKPDSKLKSMAVQLLNKVKSINTNNRSVKVFNGQVIPSYYIMATFCKSNSSTTTPLDTNDIMNLVKDILQMIKMGIYKSVDFVKIICDSPAIFLIKDVRLSYWSDNCRENAVYVVTSEYISPYLMKMKVAELRENIRDDNRKEVKRKRKCQNYPKCTKRTTVDTDEKDVEIGANEPELFDVGVLSSSNTN